MALTRLNSFATGSVVTNAIATGEFDNIYNNALTLISPLTGNLAAGGNLITGLGLGTVGSPTLQFTGDTNTGIFRLGVNASVDGLSQTATMDMSAGAGDLIGTTLVIGTGKIGGASNSSIAPVPLEGRGRQIQLEYTQSGGAEDAELYGYTIHYEPGEPFSTETT